MPTRMPPEAQAKPSSAVRAPIGVVMINFRTAAMTIDSLASIEPEAKAINGLQVVVVDNLSGDDSPALIEQAIEQRGWGDWARLERSPVNGGFSAGNNVGIEAIDADAYLLINSDTIVRPGAIQKLHAALDEHPAAGLISPRLEWPDETPQISCFRWFRPTTELVLSAKTGPISKLFPQAEPAIPLEEKVKHPQWVSFACVLVRREVIEQHGQMDDGYFMYFEDVDFSRHATQAGFEIVHEPEARVVHLRGGTSPVKELQKQLKRRPRYFFAARARYYAKFYGRFGLLRANLLWHLGRCVSWPRELIGRKERHICQGEWRDIWTNFWNPLGGRHK